MTTTHWRILFALSLAVLLTALLVPASTYAQIGKRFPVDPSGLVHAALFFFTLACLRPAAGFRLRWRHAILISFVLGACTEGLQWIVGRGPSLLEVFIDAFGGMLGWATAGCLQPNIGARERVEREPR